MNCADVENAMAAYVVGELCSKRSSEITQHVHTCDGCQAWHEEVLQMSEVWADDGAISDLNLVTPVMAQLHLRSKTEPEAVETGSRQLPGQKWSSGWSNRLVFFHYGVAAAATIALFQLGVFQHVGQLANTGAGLSHHMDRLIRAISSL